MSFRVLTDGTHVVQVGGTICDLHRFACKIGLREAWFQDHRIPHYDLTTPRAGARAVAAGAQLVSTRELLRATAQERAAHRCREVVRDVLAFRECAR